MTDNELLTTWHESDCPIRPEPHPDGVRIQWDEDDPLSYIILTHKHVGQLIERLQITEKNNALQEG